MRPTSLVQQEALESADRDRRALQRLQTVTASLASAATPSEVADAILDRGLTALGAAAGGVSRLSADGSRLELIAARGLSTDAETEPGTVFLLDGPSHIGHAVRTGEPVLLGDPEEWSARYPGSPPHPLPASDGGGSIAVLPLLAAGRVLGCAVFRFADSARLR